MMAKEKQDRQKDEDMFMMYHYIANALNVVMANFGAGLSGKRGDSKLMEEPILAKHFRELHMTQEEKDMIKIKEMIANEEKWRAYYAMNGLPQE